MTDKELADKVVALGVGNNTHDLYAIGAYHVIGCTAYDFVRDWRVAGALMEKYSVFRAGKETHYCIALPMEARTIIEACLEALTDDPTT